MKKVGCQDADVAVVDTNWAKLAAKGISIMISSGDSGSAYSFDSCGPDSIKDGVEITEGEGGGIAIKPQSRP